METLSFVAQEYGFGGLFALLLVLGAAYHFAVSLLLRVGGKLAAAIREGRK